MDANTPATDMDEIVFIVEEDRDVGGYSAVCHPYGIFTQGEDLDDLRSMVADAVCCRFKGDKVRPTQVRFTIQEARSL